MLPREPVNQITLKGVNFRGVAQNLQPSVRCGWFPNRTLQGSLGFRTFRPVCTVLTRVTP